MTHEHWIHTSSASKEIRNAFAEEERYASKAAAERDKLKAKNKELLEALELVNIVPRPWMEDANVSWPEWDAALEKIDAAIKSARGQL